MKKIKTFEEIDFHSHIIKNPDMSKWSEQAFDNESLTKKDLAIIGSKNSISYNNKHIEKLEKMIEKTIETIEKLKDEIKYYHLDSEIRKKLIDIASKIPNDDETFNDIYYSDEEANKLRKKLK